MSLNIQQLTNDGSFLLTFAPPCAPPKCTKPFPGSFRILVDPWLHGGSIIFHPKFATTQHTAAPSINSLADIQHEIDLIVISQEKADHLHKDTLCGLPRDTKIGILAAPRAAKAILAWDYFTHPEIIQTLHTYNDKKPQTITRIPIEPYSSTSALGEITIANIAARRDIAGIHNALGITYRPPGTLLRAPDGRTVKLLDMPMMSTSRPRTAQSSPSPISLTSSKQRHLKGCLDDVEWVQPTYEHALESEYHDLTDLEEFYSRPKLPDCPPTLDSTFKRQDNFENVLSVIYTPHGTDAESLQPYKRAHLSSLQGALPITALVHSLTFETNPWWMGGVVCAGAPSGVEIAQQVGVKYWISAHDELKETGGFATKLMKSQRYDIPHVVKMLREAEGMGRGMGFGTEVIALKGGETRRLIG